MYSRHSSKISIIVSSLEWFILLVFFRKFPIFDIIIKNNRSIFFTKQKINSYNAKGMCVHVSPLSLRSRLTNFKLFYTKVDYIKSLSSCFQPNLSQLLITPLNISLQMNFSLLHILLAPWKLCRKANREVLKSHQVNFNFSTHTNSTGKNSKV